MPGQISVTRVIKIFPSGNNFVARCAFHEKGVWTHLQIVIDGLDSSLHLLDLIRDVCAVACSDLGYLWKFPLTKMNKVVFSLRNFQKLTSCTFILTCREPVDLGNNVLVEDDHEYFNVALVTELLLWCEAVWAEVESLDFSQNWLLFDDLVGVDAWWGG